ncbi:MAG: class I SAM-dependent methyltransferase [Salinarimonas sp.]|nr:class I SAM-dependent methyltransferase [Salinarimonas sp.]
MPGSQTHWNDVYATKDEGAVSWFEESPKRSLRMIRATGVSAQDAIIDVGGGLSRLADALLGDGFADVSVLDISQEAIDRLIARNTGDPRLTGIVSDVTAFEAPKHYRLWHDRAVLHFLTDDSDRAAYHAALTKALAPGGHVIVATFAPDGPERCSGLPVRRYGIEDFDAFFGPEFERVSDESFNHVTPAGAEQRFQAAHYRRRG